MLVVVVASSVVVVASSVVSGALMLVSGANVVAVDSLLSFDEQLARRPSERSATRPKERAFAKFIESVYPIQRCE